jgi:hypothetical protein
MDIFWGPWFTGGVPVILLSSDVLQKHQGWRDFKSTRDCGHFWPIVQAPDDRWGWLWSNWWNEDWQGKPKHAEKTYPSATLSTRNSTWPDPGSNPGRRGVKPATNRLSYGAARLKGWCGYMYGSPYASEVPYITVWPDTRPRVYPHWSLYCVTSPEITWTRRAIQFQSDKVLGAVVNKL